jgi:putative phosphoribosyl transferase
MPGPAKVLQEWSRCKRTDPGEEMIFSNRTEAGRRLALRLRDYANRKDVIVLGIPRGGVPVAFEVARTLKVPLDVLVLRKLGIPGHEELGFGAIASGGIRALNPEIVGALRISPWDIELVTNRERKELKRREHAYRGRRPPLHVTGLTVILVDDGIATGSGMRAAIDALRQMKPAHIVIAVPVAPGSTCDRLRSDVDDLVCLETPEPFYGVGQFYFDFSQVSDQEVNELLDRAAREIAEQEHATAEVAAAQD